MLEQDPTRTTILRENFAQALRGVFRNVRKKVVDAYKQDIYTDDFLRKTMDSPEFREVVQKYIGKAYFRGETYAGREIAKAIGMPQPEPIIAPHYYKPFTDITDILIKGFTEEQNNRVASLIPRALLEGKTRLQIAQEIGDTFEIAYNRANKIARTEIIRTFNYAAKDRYEQAGATHFKWLTHIDERTCPECKALNGKIFKFGEHLIAPRHTNCRCSLIPVWKK